MISRSVRLLAGTLSLLPAAVGAQAPAPAGGSAASTGPVVLSLSLAEAEERALATSPALEALGREVEAARAAARGQRAFLAPDLRFDASGRYQSDVPALTLPLPGLSPRPLGDNWNYSVGPTLQWTAWDQGSVRRAWESLVELARSRGAELDAARRSTLLAARTSYFQARLALESLRLLGDDLALAASQHRDIKLGLEAGTKSRIDLLMAHQELLARKRQFRQARADVSLALRDLFRLTGWGEGADVSLPLGARMAASPPEGIEPPTCVIAMDPVERSASALDAAARAGPDPAHPSLAALASQERSLSLAAASYRSQRWPRLTLSARSSLEYPNGPVLRDYFQHAVGLAASMPLFEWGRTAERAREAKERAAAALSRRESAWRDLERDWLKASDQLASLRSQAQINKESVAEASELADLVYASYQAGRSTFLEVQSANVRALEAKVVSSRTDVQILLQLAALASLAK